LVGEGGDVGDLFDGKPFSSGGREQPAPFDRR